MRAGICSSFERWDLLIEIAYYPQGAIEDYAIHLGAIVGYFSLFFFLSKKDGRGRVFWPFMVVLTIAGVVSLLWLGLQLDRCYVEIPPFKITESLVRFCGSSAAAVIAATFAVYVGGKIRDKKVSFFAGRNSLREDRFSDIRFIANELPREPGKIDPRCYLRNAPKRFYVGVLGVRWFWGLVRFRRALYLPLNIVDEGHTQIVGPPRHGKGLFLQSSTLQGLVRGRTIVVLDPRKDKYLPNVLWEYCNEAELPYHYLDTSYGQPQCNPLKGLDRNQALSLLTTVLDIRARGDKSDYYQTKNRKLARLIADMPNVGDLSFQELITIVLRDFPEESADAEGFIDSLTELADEPFLQTRNGIDLRKEIEAGGVIYITGDPTSDIQMRILKMLTQVILQIAVSRGQGNGREIEIVLDEVKEILSEATLKCLSLAAASNVKVYVVHQSLGDIKQPVGSYPGDAVFNIITTNCANTIVFCSPDPDTAEFFSRASGTRRAFSEGIPLQQNSAGFEGREDRTTLIESDTAFASTNLLQSLPKSCAMLLHKGLPKFFYVGPVEVSQDRRAMTPTTYGDSEIAVGTDAHAALIDVD